MKVKILLALLLFGTFFFTSCEKDDNKNDDSSTEIYDFADILIDYVDKTIVPTYTDMKDNAKLLAAKATDLKISGSQDDLNAACDYWEKTRAPWEAGESFLFGPAAFNNLDPLLDSWPLDRAQLQAVLDGSQELTADFVRDGLGAVLRGFHAVEFLIYQDGEPKIASELTEREKDYLVAVSQVLMEDCVKLWALWEGGTAEQAILDDIEFEVVTPYATEFKQAGEVGSRYFTQVDAIDEMLQGMIGIADEVGNGKIADPHESGNVLDVESWFSWNSLTDFQNNIISIENSYLGGYAVDARGVSLSEFVKEKDADLDVKVLAAIDEAIAAIASIPKPFRNNLSHANVQVAMDACNSLMNILDREVRPLIVN